MSEIPLLALLLFIKRGRKIGASEKELRELFGDKLPELLAKLEEYLKPLGLTLKFLEDERTWIITLRPEYAHLIPSYITDRNTSAVLAACLLLFARKREIKMADLYEFFRDKMSAEELKRRLVTLERRGYIKRGGDKILLKRRVFLEIDVERFLTLISKHINLHSH